MKLQGLIGQRAIRTKPVITREPMVSVGFPLMQGPVTSTDFSFCTIPIIIIKATKHHVYYVDPRNPCIGKTVVMDPKYCDDNWTIWDPPTHEEVQKVMDRFGERLDVRVMSEKGENDDSMVPVKS